VQVNVRFRIFTARKPPVGYRPNAVISTWQHTRKRTSRRSAEGQKRSFASGQRSQSARHHERNGIAGRVMAVLSRLGKWDFHKGPLMTCNKIDQATIRRANVFVSDDLPNMGTPRFQSFSAFGEEIVALIDGCNA
jgi:hypothetical protein